MKIKRQKIKKLNNNGTMAIVLPKSESEKFWKIGDECDVELIGQDYILIDKSPRTLRVKTLNEVFELLQKVVETEKDLIGTVQEMAANLKDKMPITLKEDVCRDMIKTALISVIKQI